MSETFRTVSSTTFVNEGKKKIPPQMLADKFTSVFPNEPVTRAINDLARDQNFKAWKDIRTILAHRSSPGRRFALL
jgi:hypothetical protein